MAEQKNQRECAVHIFVPSKDAWRQESFILCNRIGGSWQDQAFRLFLLDTYFCWNIFFSIVASYLNAPKLLRANLFLMNFVEKKSFSNMALSLRLTIIRCTQFGPLFAQHFFLPVQFIYNYSGGNCWTFRVNA